MKTWGKWAGLLVALSAAACSRSLDQHSAQLRAEAPQSQTDTGLIVQNVTEDDLAGLLDAQVQAQVRLVHRARGIYEVFGVSLERLQTLLPQARILPNRFVTTKSVNLQQLHELAEDSTLADNPFALCLWESQGPEAVITPISPKAQLKKEVVALGTKIKLSGSKSLSQVGGKLLVGWLVLPPQGSLQEKTLKLSEDIEYEADSYGLHQLILVVQDEDLRCGLQPMGIVVTGNEAFHKLSSGEKKRLKDLRLTDFFHLNEVEAEDAWEVSQGKGQLIAVIDSGVNYNHPALGDNIRINKDEIPDNNKDDDKNGFVDDVVGYDFANTDAFPYDDDGHGSHVAGLAASSVFGLAREAQILPIKAMTPRGGDIASVAAAIYYAVDSGARVLNMSFGGYGAAHPLLVEALDYSESKDVVVISAAGNGDPDTGMGINTDKAPNFPSALPNENIVSVAAKDQEHVLAPYSNYGHNTVDVVAPGGYKDKDLILSAFLENPKKLEYVGLSGTSMAAPIVAGITAQILALNPEMKAAKVIKILLKSGEKVKELKGLVRSGRYLNAKQAVEAGLKASPAD